MYVIEAIRNGEEVTDLGTQLALQVYALNNIFLEESVVFPYRPTPTIQIGKFQNAVEEINQKYLDQHNIPVVRRDTGGGAIYMDLNQINFVFLLEGETNLNENFQHIYNPAIRALEKMGAKNVKQSGRNDLEIEGQKISGAALTIVNERLYGGYSLLLDNDLEAMSQALSPSRKKIQSKGIKSVRSRVGSIRDYLASEYQNITVEEFRDRILAEILQVEDLTETKKYVLSDEEWAQVDQLVEEKYANWDWNFGRSPRYEYNREGRFAAGTIQISLEVSKGYIKKCKIYGDFFGSNTIHEVEDQLTGVRIRRKDLNEALGNINLGKYINNLKNEELIDLILE